MIKMKTGLFKKMVAVPVALLLPISALMCAGGGIDGSGFRSQGPITGFGSIIVNGTELDTQRVAVVINGQTVGIGDDAVLGNLAVGQVVTVEGKTRGSSDGIIAQKVFYNSSVKGPVESVVEIDPLTKQIVVMGQSVIINTATQFNATSFDTISPNDTLEVSGLFDDTATLWATFIKSVGTFTPGMQVELEGYITNLDTFAQRFEVNNLIVDYALADTSGLTGGIKEGLLIEVSGTLNAVSDPLQATRIRPGDDLDDADVDQIEVIGFVTDFISSAEFMVGNLMVQTDSGTQFVDGTAADVALGVKLEAEGRLEAGVLTATEVEFWGPGQIEIEGLVTDFTSVNEFKIGEQVVRPDSQTVFEGLDPVDLAEGLNLEIKGVPIDIERSAILADKVSLE